MKTWIIAPVAAVAVAAWLLTASNALAQQRLTVDNGDDGGAPALSCVDIATCNNSTGCATASADLGVPLVCSSTLLGQGQCLLSSNGQTELICCQPGGVNACPTRLGSQGFCTPVLGSQVSVCLYPDLFPICPSPTGAGVTTATVAACFRLPGSNTYTIDWRKGDCDGDGVANASDCYPCDHTRWKCPDAGVPGPDAGMASSDGGSAAPDGGADAGPAANASPPSFRGNGGCKCSTVADGNPAGQAAPILLLFGLVALRRRRWR